LYEVHIPRKAQKSLDSFEFIDYERVFRAVQRLKSDLRPKQAKKLAAQPGSIYRIRVGDFRILYEIDDKNRIVSIHRIDRRDKVYQ